MKNLIVTDFGGIIEFGILVLLTVIFLTLLSIKSLENISPLNKSKTLLEILGIQWEKEDKSSKEVEEDIRSKIFDQIKHEDIKCGSSLRVFGQPYPIQLVGGGIISLLSLQLVLVSIVIYNWDVVLDGGINFIYSGVGVQLNINNFIVQFIGSFFIILFLISMWSLGIPLLAEEVILFFLLGVFFIFLSFSSDLLTFFIFFEGVSLTLYILVSFRSITAGGKIRPVRAVINYLVFGMVGSVLMVYGMSLLWGISGLVNFNDLSLFIQYLKMEGGDSRLFLVALLLVLCNLLFKLGVAPFHFWVVPVYRAALDHIFYFLAIYSKPAFFFVFFLKFGKIFVFFEEIFMIFTLIGLFSIVFGTFGALMENYIKRLVAYSAIANIGFAFVALGAGGDIPLAAFFILFYSLVTWYMLYNLFLYCDLFNLNQIFHRVDDMRFIHSIMLLGRWADFWTIISIFSAIGIPPLAGFFIKFELVIGFLHGYFSYHGLVLLLFMFFSVLGSFYYLRLVKSILLGWTGLLRGETTNIILRPVTFKYRFIRRVGFLFTLLFFYYRGVILIFLESALGFGSL